MKFKEFLLEDKPIGSKNKEIWKQFLNKFADNPIDKLFLTFVSEDKVGINPRSKYDTPIGVYAYPLEYIFKRIKSGLDVPFRGIGSKKIKILEIKSDKVLSNDFSEKDLEKVKKEILEKYKMFSEKNLDGFSDDAKFSNPFGKLWNITRIVSDKNPKKWSKLLLDLGFDVVIDNGVGVIHTNEPTQALFINPSSYKVVDEEFIDTEKRYNELHKSSTFTLDDFRKIFEDLTEEEYHKRIELYKNRIKKLLSEKEIYKGDILQCVGSSFRFEFIKEFKNYFENYLIGNLEFFYDVCSGTINSNIQKVLEEFHKEFIVMMKNRFQQWFFEYSFNVDNKTFSLICKELYDGISQNFKNKEDLSFVDNDSRRSKEHYRYILEYFEDGVREIYKKDPHQIEYCPQEYVVEIIEMYKDCFKNQSQSFYTNLLEEYLKNQDDRYTVMKLLGIHFQESYIERVNRIL